MDLSGIIFVALAVAWAVYLIPKAIKHHDEVVRSRSIDRFSHRMRVLARREPVSSRDSRLVVAPGRASSAASVVEAKAARPTAAQVRSARLAARKATRRRRRVLGVLAFLNVVVAALAFAYVIGWAWQAVPVALTIAWLVACRLMVKKERAVFAPVLPSVVVPSEADAEEPETVVVERNEQGFDEVGSMSDTASIPVVAVGESTLWDPLPMTLPTYVSKPAATRRSVRTIALDDTGVWTSGRTEADSALARQADAQSAAARTEADGDEQRAVGS